MPKIPIPGRYRRLAEDIAAMACDRVVHVDEYVELEKSDHPERADGEYPQMRAHLESCVDCQARYQKLRGAHADPAPAGRDA